MGGIVEIRPHAEAVPAPGSIAFVEDALPMLERWDVAFCPHR
jgi:hypothetical protein